jgi:hypothetical protein
VLLFRATLLAADLGRGEGGQCHRVLRRICDAEFELVWRRQARGWRRLRYAGSEVGVGVEEAPVVMEWVGGGGREAQGWRRCQWWWLSWEICTVFPENEGVGGCDRNMQRLLRLVLEQEQCACRPHFRLREGIRLLLETV